MKIVLLILTFLLSLYAGLAALTAYQFSTH
jgi:hypothetical protein